MFPHKTHPGLVWLLLGIVAFTLAGWQAAAENLERWHAVYFPLYENGKPTQLVFVGCSGD